MRNEIPQRETASKDLMEGSVSLQEIKDETRCFFQNFSQKYWESQPEPDERQMFLAEVTELDQQTAPNENIVCDTADQELTAEDVQQIMEGDPGYVNDRVLDYESDIYQKTGLHVIHWGHYAAKEGIEYKMLPAGTVLSRWGDECGTFLSDIDTSYDQLELPVVQDKNERTLYEVVKPFPVEISRIALQPWNQKGGSTDGSSALQYKAPVPVKELLQEGYLTKQDT